jgi:hypothetical protein
MARRSQPEPKPAESSAKLMELVEEVVRTVRMVIEIIDAIRRGLGV